MKINRKGYTTLNATIYPVFDEVCQVYTVISIGNPLDDNPAQAVVMAQVIGDHIIIHADTTDKPLVNALVQADIPRAQINLAYTGESMPGISR